MKPTLIGARKFLKGHSRFFLPSYYDLSDIGEKRDQKLMIAFEAGCSTTAMGIMPHRDVEWALELALSLDIPTLGKSSLSDLGDNLNLSLELRRFLHWLPLQ